MIRWLPLCWIVLLAAAHAVHAAEFSRPDCRLPDETRFPLRGTANYRGGFADQTDPMRTLGVLYSLGQQGSLLYGSYVYEKVGLPLRLRGCRDSSGRFVLVETDLEGAITGRIHGQFDPPFDRLTDFEGLWSAATGSSRFEIYGALTTDSSTSGLDCVGSYGGMSREEEGEFRPLPTERLQEADRKNLVRFGPFDRAVYGFEGAVAELKHKCTPGVAENLVGNTTLTRCETELLVGIIDRGETTWWVRTFEQEQESSLDYLSPFRLTEAAAPSLPEIVLTDEVERWYVYSSGTTATHRLIELEGGRPSIRWAQACVVAEGTRDWNGRPHYSQKCRWVPERGDFLCREESGYSPLWAIRTGSREFWLTTGEPHFVQKSGESAYRTPESFLAALPFEPDALEERVVIDHIGEVTHIETLGSEGDRRVHLFGAPQRGVVPGARFFVAETGVGDAGRWGELPALRVRFGDDDRYCYTASPLLFRDPGPEEDPYTPSESHHAFVARQIETGVAGLRLLQVLVAEGRGDDSCRSVHWIAIDLRQSPVHARALLLFTEGLNSGSGLDLGEMHFPRVLQVGPARPGTLASLLISPPASADYLAPRDRLPGPKCPSPQWFGLSWTGSRGFDIAVEEGAPIPVGRGYEEPLLDETGEIILRPAPPSLAEQILGRLREGGIDAAVARVQDCYREGSEDPMRFLVIWEIIEVVERLLAEGRVGEAVAIIDSVGSQARDRDVFVGKIIEVVERLLTDGRIGEAFTIIEPVRSQARYQDVFIGKIIEVVERLLADGRIGEAAAIIDLVRPQALDRFTSMLVDVGRPDRAVILLKRTLPAANPGIGKVESACTVLAGTSRRADAIEIAKVYIDRWRTVIDAQAVEQFEAKVRDWEAMEAGSPGATD